MFEYDQVIRAAASERILSLEKHLDADVLFYYGPIYHTLENRFRDAIERLKEEALKRDRLAIILTTTGGSAEVVEKLVEITRHHYKEIWFIVTDEAMSAGTLFALSGDAIYMDYTSSLGPIDPQVFNGKDFVPALGYLDQVDKMIEKSAQGTLTDAELVILQNQDLALLSQFEQAKNLTITLLKKWLVEYKFKDWTHHQTNPLKKGQPVTDEEKIERAEEIAKNLSDNKIWHSHGRKIGLGTLRRALHLKIEDFAADAELSTKIRSHVDLVTDYIKRHEWKTFLTTRAFF